jgi:type IV pilus assembly protein PilA
MNRKKSHAAKGFTLVEIMIVVLIISLLAAMAIPAFNRVRYVARKKAITNNLRIIGSAAQQYMLEQGASQVGDTQMEGTSSFNYYRPISKVNAETYNGLVVGSTTTQLSTVESDGTVVTFNL